MQAGKLDSLVTIQQQTATQDDFGQTVETWTAVATVWAEVRDITGKEFVAAQATQNTVQTVITIRVRDGIKPSMRAVHGADVYNIEAVLRRKKDALMLMCSRHD